MTLRIIGGQFKGRILKTPKGISTRPTQGMLREAVFNICQNEIEGINFLDLFAGSGAIGFEALSRGAAHVTFVEQNQNAIAVIRENIETLKVTSQTLVMTCPAKTAIQRLSTPFMIIYVDPPYDCSAVPLIEMLLNKKLLLPQAILFLEERNRANVSFHHFSELTRLGSRRFGEALLHQYRFIRPLA